MYLHTHITPGLVSLLLATTSLFGQSPEAATADKKAEQQSQIATLQPAQRVVIVTGARFSYQLIEKWIDAYARVNPDVQIIVEARGSSDPLKYDVLAEVYQHGEELKSKRAYVNVGRYAILPVANSASSFASVYADKGLHRALINQIYFHDVFADQEKQEIIKNPFTVYTRLQKAGVPSVFAKYFGHDQKDIKGSAIAGADAHLIRAVQRDSTGLTYLPLPLIFDPHTRKPVEGLTVLPVDLNGNKKVSDDEKIYDNIDRVIEHLETRDSRDIKNVPIEYLHLSVDKQNASPEAIDFLKWVNENGEADLHAFGYLKPDSRDGDKDKFEQFASGSGIQQN